MMKKLRIKGIRRAAGATRNADYRVKHVQIEYDPIADAVTHYLPGPFGYYEPDNEENIVIHIFAPTTMKTLREMIEQKYLLECKD